MTLAKVSPKRWPSTVTMVVGAMLCLWLGTLTYISWGQHNTALTKGLSDAELHTRNLENYLTQSLRIIELSATNFELHLQPDFDQHDVGKRLIDAVRAAPFLRSLSIADANGRIVASSASANLGKRVALDSLFPYADAAVQVVRIGTLQAGRDWSNRPTDATPAASEAALSTFLPVALSLSSSSSSSSTTYWLVAALNPDLFVNHATDQLGATIGSIVWLRYDGVALWASKPDPSGALTHAAKALGLELPQKEFSQFAQTLSDGTEVLTAYRASSRYPIAVTIHLDRNATLSTWRKDIRERLLIVIPALGLMLVGWAAYRRRSKAFARSDAEMAKQRELAGSVFAHAQEAIMITDPQGVMIEVNNAFTRITGFGREEVVGHDTRMLGSGRQSKDFYAAMWEELVRTGEWTGEIWNRRKSGEVYAEMLTIGAVRSPDGSVLHYVALFSDISQQKEHEKKLERIAHFDALTGLPNRVLLSDRLLQAMATTCRRDRQLAVVFLDLDGFKSVNDTHGHSVGDQLLIALALRMGQSLREGDTLARLGGDEFVAVLQDLDTREDCIPVLGRLRAAAAQAVLIENKAIQVSASLGVSFYPQQEEMDADQLMRQADQAMYQAKLSGKNRYHVFDAEHDRNLRDYHESLEGLRTALEYDQFLLYYQPKVNMRTGEILGAEALIRWQHPEKGLLSPAQFLPSLENNALAIDVGKWVVRTALLQMATWRKQGLRLPVSVNMDAQLLQQHDVMDWLTGELARHPELPPSDLQLEVLETTALGDMAHVSEVMTRCNAIGVGFALDDFGTGYSSLTYLKRLPAQELKIDQSFIRDMLDDAEDLAILQGVLVLASAFQRSVIAEGVESIEHGCMLLRLGCARAQGYVIALPMPGEAIPDWAASWRPDARWLAQQPLDINELPLLFAAAEHRAWMAIFKAHFLGGHPQPPIMSPHDSRFGKWLHHAGTAHRHAHSCLLAQIVDMHHALHEQAEALRNRKFAYHGMDASDPRYALDQLEALSSTLYAALLQLAEDAPRTVPLGG